MRKPIYKVGDKVVPNYEHDHVVEDTYWYKNVPFTVMQNYYRGDDWLFIYADHIQDSYRGTGGGMYASDYVLDTVNVDTAQLQALGSKPTNPKDAVGIKKAPMSVIPANVLGELGLALMEGARKYGRHNYRKVGVRSSVYYDAALRHLMDWWEGVDTDKDSGLSHIVKAMACMVVLRDSMLRGNLNDDRPPASPEGWLEELNKKAEALIDKYPESKDAFTREST